MPTHSVRFLTDEDRTRFQVGFMVRAVNSRNPTFVRYGIVHGHSASRILVRFIGGHVTPIKPTNLQVVSGAEYDLAVAAHRALHDRVG